MTPSCSINRQVKIVVRSGGGKGKKVKVRTLDIAPLRETPPQKRSGTDHTVLPANFTVPASTS